MNLIQIENRTGKVKLNDAVTPWSSDDLIGDIEKLYGAKAVAENLCVGEFTAKADDALETLEIEINSPGGSVLDGYRVYHALMGMRERGVRVIATGNGIVASMASVIFMAADERRITQGSRIMIHEAQQSIAGDSDDHARAAKILDEMSEEIAAIYASVTGATTAEMRELMKKETWMGATEAVERKFADFIIGKSGVDIRSLAAKPLDMGLFTSRAELENKITGYEARINELESEVTASATALADAQSELATARESIAAAESPEAIAILREELEAATAAASTEAVTGLAVKLIASAEAPEAIREAISAQASAMLAASGHVAISTTESESNQSSVTPHLDIFNNLTGPKKSAYYQAHGKEIRKEATI